VCEKKCGFSGSFDVVASHETTCAGRTNFVWVSGGVDAGKGKGTVCDAIELE
jgi:hypothetical protein